MWKIKYLPQSLKLLKKLDNSTKKRIIDYLEKLAKKGDPESSGAPLSANLSGFRKYRVGDHRIICDLKKNELIILVIDIGHRSVVYKTK